MFIVASDLFLERNKAVRRIAAVSVVHPGIIRPVGTAGFASCPRARHDGRIREINGWIGVDVRGAAHRFRPGTRVYTATSAFRGRADRPRVVEKPPTVAVVQRKIPQGGEKIPDLAGNGHRDQANPSLIIKPEAADLIARISAAVETKDPVPIVIVDIGNTGLIRDRAQ